MSRALLLAAAWIVLALPAKAASMPMDEPVTLPNGITTVCTGVGEAKDDPRWTAYPIRVEFANAAEQYVAGAHLTLRRHNVVLADLDCFGAWVLFQLPVGKYDVQARLLDTPDAGSASASFVPPSSGQKRVVLVFKGAAPH